MSVIRSALFLVTCGMLVGGAWAGTYGHENETENLVSNWDFETDLSGWTCAQCTAVQASEGYTGNKSANVTNRSSSTKALKLKLTGVTQTSTPYYCSFFIKITDNPNNIEYFTFSLLIKQKFTTGDTSQNSIGNGEYNVHYSPEWSHIGADFFTDSREATFTQLWIRDIPVNVSYLIDTVSLTEIQPNPNWETEADERIEDIRKNWIIMTGDVPVHMDKDLVQLNLTQTKRSFGTGTAVKASTLVESSTFADHYRSWILQYANWATIENKVKWRSMEAVENVIVDEVAFDAQDWLDANDILSRGHCELWNTATNNPDWVKILTGAALKNATLRRVEYVTTNFSGRFEHWDVMNSQLGEKFHETGVGEYDLFLTYLQNTATNDPNVQLYLSEFSVFKDPGNLNSAMADLARGLLEFDPSIIHGLGVQSHFRDIPVSIEILIKRLEILEAVGLPIWLTELSVHSLNVTERALFMNDILKLYFSRERVEGIMLWGFSDQKIFATDCALAEGDNITNNELGEVWANTIASWTTEESVTPSVTSFTEGVKGFHGDYHLDVYHNSVWVSGQDFSLSKGLNTTVSVSFI